MIKTAQVWILFVSLILSSCGSQHAATVADREAQESDSQRGSMENIVILGTNDIHGTILPLALKTRDPQPVDYEAGGVAYLGAYVKKLRSDLGSRLLWLDAGDQYQGSIESNSNRGRAMVQFFNTAGLDASAIGNHEFDFGAEPAGSTDLTSSLKNRMTEAHYPYLAANIFDKTTGALASFPDTFPTKIFDTGKLKVGVIGLSTIDTPNTTRPENVAALKFENFKETTLREAKNLRDQGAQIIVVVTHAGLFCDLPHTPPGHLFRKPTDPQGECKSEDEVVKFIHSLPPGTIDAVVSGHTHSLVYHYIDGVPVIQAGSNGRYINLIHLTYDFGQKKIVGERTRIEGPIPVCPKVFANQGDCNGDRPAPLVGRGELVTPIFRREEIRADADIQKAMQPYIAQADAVRNEVYGQAARRMDPERFKESSLGNLVVDALRDLGDADFAITNSGGIRASIESGPITYGSIFRTVPFDNELIVLTVNGRILKQILQVGESGSRGFHSVSGLTLRLISPDVDAPAEDLNGNGKIDPWEINRIIEVKTTAGEPIDDKKEYKLATLDYLTSGGDDYGWVMSKIPNTDKKRTGIMVRDAVAAYIRKLSGAQGPLNSVEHPLVDPAHPRMVFEKPKKAKGKRKRKQRRKKSDG